MINNNQCFFCFENRRKKNRLINFTHSMVRHFYLFVYFCIVDVTWIFTYSELDTRRVVINKFWKFMHEMPYKMVIFWSFAKFTSTYLNEQIELCLQHKLDGDQELYFITFVNINIEIVLTVGIEQCLLER